MATQASLEFVQSLYVGYYGRPADNEGLQYWAERADEEGQDAIVNAFGTSEEFTTLADGQSNEELVQSLYKQLFGRDAETEGLEFYTGMLDSGEKSLAQIAQTIMNAASGVDRLVLDAKTTAADYYTSNVADGDYDLDFASQLVDSIDGTSTGADQDAAIQAVDNAVLEGEIAANYQAVQTAEQTLASAEKALDKALGDLAENTELGYDGADGSGENDEVSVAEVQEFVNDQKAAISLSEINNGSDAELAQEVEDAEQAIRDIEGNFDEDGDSANGEGGITASDLLDDFLEARSAVEADVEANGESMALAKSLNADLAAYLANNDDLDDGTALADLQLAAQAYIDAGADGEGAFLDAVDGAEAEIFSGDNDASVLADDPAAGDIESLVSLLDERNDLVDAQSDANAALTNAAGDEFVDLLMAEGNVELRAEQRETLEEAESDLAELTALQDDVDSAKQSLDDAEDALGYEVVDIAAGDVGTDDEAELFVFDKEETGSMSVGLEDSDAIFLGAGYALGDADNADDSQLEVFFEESGSDTVATVEVFADGSDASNVELTLTGVPAEDVSFSADTGVIAIA